MEEIINSVMQTPGNTNPNVLRGQLQGMASGSVSASGVLVVHDVDGTLDKTWQEIVDADLAVLKANGETAGTTAIIASWEVDGGYYTVGDINGNSYTADAASGYPVKNSGGNVAVT